MVTFFYIQLKDVCMVTGGVVNRISALLFVPKQ
jgi:hypothetical protein